LPGGDRTGPNGLGPRTGRGLGYCSGFDSPGYTRGPGMGGYFGGGRGRGRGIRFSRGFRGFGGYWPPSYNPFVPISVPNVTPENQIDILKQEKEYLESEMNEINKAINDITKKITNVKKPE